MTEDTATRRRARDPRLPGRGEAAAAPHDPLAVLEPRDLPARAGLQRLRRLRQAALRGARTTPALFEDDAELADPHRLRPRGAHPHRGRQRHRHEPRRGGREPRHHRQVRHARVLLAAHRRPAEGRAPDRPVRRRLLLVLHRGRQGDGADAPRRARPRPGRALGVRRRRRVHRRDGGEGRRAAPRSRCTCARARTTCWTARGCARSSAGTPTTSCSPSSCRRRSGRTARRRRPREDETVNQAQRPLGARQGRHHRRGVQGVLQARRPRLRGSARLGARARRGAPGIHAAPLRPVARAVRPLGPQRAPRREALRAPRLHHGRRGAAAARVPALRARRGRLQRPAAQRLARDPAGVEGHRGDPRRLHEEGARPARGPRRGREGEVRRPSGRPSAAC